MITLNGHAVALYQNHTFSFLGPKNVKRYLYCSRKLSARCPAKLKLNDAGDIVEVVAIHTHLPIRMVKILNGNYIKV